MSVATQQLFVIGQEHAITRSAVPQLVIDTNVVLDWLVFDDIRCRHLIDAIEGHAVECVATQPMHEELARVLTRPLSARVTFDAEAAGATWKRWTTTVDEPGLASQAQWMRCSDPDDQKFIDLAIIVGANALLTRDRALLALAKRALSFGVRVVRPEEWSSPVR